MIFFQWNWIRDFGWREQRNQNMAPRSVKKRVVTKEASSSPEIDKVKQRVSFFFRIDLIFILLKALHFEF